MASPRCDGSDWTSAAACIDQDNRCWISLSEADAVSVIDFATDKEFAHFPVGDHPQRIRHGWVRESIVPNATNTEDAATTPTPDPLASLLGGLTSVVGVGGLIVGSLPA